jgi:hypothetical protein
MFEAAEADLAAVKKVLEDAQLQGCVVRLRGLPYTATAEDVAAFFQVSTRCHSSAGHIAQLKTADSGQQQHNAVLPQIWLR